MQLFINGRREEVNDLKNIDDLIQKLGYSANIAVAVNGVIVFKEDYAQVSLQENMKIEILTPKAGG